jgi:lipopolysaccharide biosynthesis regulator YciM
MTNEKIACPHCGQSTSTDTGFCDSCGIEIQTQALKPLTAAEAMASGTLELARPACPHCGHKLRPNARHCPNCGKKINPAAQAQPETEVIPGVLQVGMVIAERYGLESVLGQGGMGRVWKAFDQNLQKHVVIKTIVAPEEGLRLALEKEARILINIRHPNVISVIDFFSIENELCYVMEFVKGPSWADEIEEPVSRRLVKPMSAEQALLRLKGLLPAFQYLHSLNPPIIYCDFKPANVKRLTLPSGEIVEVLLDFGTAYLYDANVPPKPARGTPGYHSPQAQHPDWRDDYYTLGRTLAELVGMAEVHSEEYQFKLTAPDAFPWTQYDEAFRYFVQWLTAPTRDDRPQNVAEISAQLDGVLGYVRGQQPDKRAAKRARASFRGVTLDTMRVATQTGVVSGTVKIDLPEIPPQNPASTILLSAQDAYQQRNFTRALLLSNQAVNNNGGAAAYVLRALVQTQLGNKDEAAASLSEAKQLSDPQVKWEMLLAEGQMLENNGKFEEAEDRYERMMALKPGDHRARLLLADLYRRSGNTSQALDEYRAVIQSRPSVGAAYLGASKAYLMQQQLDNAIKILQEVNSRNTSYNDVMLELIALYNQQATQGDVKGLEAAAHAIKTLKDNGVESRVFYRLIGEFYFTAYQLAAKTNQIPAIQYPEEGLRTLNDLARANERAWRAYLNRDSAADREFIIHERIMAARTWQWL